MSTDDNVKTCRIIALEGQVAELRAERDALRVQLQSKQIVIESRDQEISSTAAEALALQDEINAVAMTLLTAWNMDTHLTYVDPVQGTRVICDEVRDLRARLETAEADAERLHRALWLADDFIFKKVGTRNHERSAALAAHEARKAGEK